MIYQYTPLLIEQIITGGDLQQIIVGVVFFAFAITSAYIVLVNFR